MLHDHAINAGPDSEPDLSSGGRITFLNTAIMYMQKKKNPGEK